MTTVGPVREQQVDVGVTLAVRRWVASRPAAGPPMLLVHGLASNARLWDGVAPVLAGGGFETAAVDLRGHGRSAKPDTGYDVPTVAGDLARLLDLLGWSNPIVVGQSYGANVAVALAAAHPGRLAGIACIDGGYLDLQARFPAWADCARELAPPPLVGTPVGELTSWLVSAHPDWPRSGIDGALACFEVRPDATVAPWLTLDRHLAVLRGLWEQRPLDLLSGLDLPVLLVPADTPGDPRGAAKRLAVEQARAVLRRGRVSWLVGDHDLHAQHPQQVADLLADWVRG